MNDVDTTTERKIRTGQTIRLVLLAVVAAVVVVWAFANTEDTEVDLLFTTATMPLVVVIAASAGLGMLFGLILAWRRSS